MSTVRTPRRWIDARTRAAAEIDRGALILLAAACAGLFMVSFALGRVLSPAAQAGQGALARVAAAQAGEPLPVSLTAAPAIRLGVAVAPKAPARRVVRGPAVATQRPFAPAVAQTPAAIAPVAPVPTRSAPASSKGSGGGGGISFDTSG
jgi:hypothetical protein